MPLEYKLKEKSSPFGDLDITQVIIISKAMMISSIMINIKGGHVEVPHGLR